MKTIDQIPETWLTFYEASSRTMTFTHSTNSVMKFAQSTSPVMIDVYFRGPRYFSVIKVHTVYSINSVMKFIPYINHVIFSVNSVHQTHQSLPELVESPNPSKFSQSTKPTVVNSVQFIILSSPSSLSSQFVEFTNFQVPVHHSYLELKSTNPGQVHWGFTNLVKILLLHLSHQSFTESRNPDMKFNKTTISCQTVRV